MTGGTQIKARLSQLGKGVAPLELSRSPRVLVTSQSTPIPFLAAGGSPPPPHLPGRGVASSGSPSALSGHVGAADPIPR